MYSYMGFRRFRTATIIDAPAKCEVRSVIRFIQVEVHRATEINRKIYCGIKVSLKSFSVKQQSGKVSWPAEIYPEKLKLFSIVAFIFLSIFPRFFPSDIVGIILSTSNMYTRKCEY